MKKISYFIILLFVVKSVAAQQHDTTDMYHRKGSFYFYYGYNRSIYSKTNIHFSGPNYDFTLYDLKGADRPSEFSATYFNPTTFSVPQYNYRLGYFITNNFAVSGGMDHMKYVVNHYQPTKISGVITEQASAKYAGTYLNHSIEMQPDLLEFEHTNGFNFASLDLEYVPTLLRCRKANFYLLWTTGIGGVWVITKTEVYVMGDGIDNRFHLSGYALAGKTGPRFEYKHRVFISAEAKGGYATLPDVLIKNSSPERADHSLWFLEWYVVLGVNLRIHHGGK